MNAREYDLKEIGKWLTGKGLFDKPFNKFDKLEIELFCDAVHGFTKYRDCDEVFDRETGKYIVRKAVFGGRKIN